nr:protein late bloomer isoform X1 [Drosophila bipectinata]
MHCHTIFLKYLVYLFNTLIALVGISLIVVSVIGVTDDFYNGRSLYSCVIAIGAVSILISIVGFYGAIKENFRITLAYAILLIIVLILTIVPLFFKFDGHSIALKALNRAWAKEMNGTDGMSLYQEKFHCCGITGPQDYQIHGIHFPKSCYCKKSNNVFRAGCLGYLEAFCEQFRIVNWIHMVIEIAAFVSATALAVKFLNRIRGSYESF